MQSKIMYIFIFQVLNMMIGDKIPKHKMELFLSNYSKNFVSNI